MFRFGYLLLRNAPSCWICFMFDLFQGICLLNSRFSLPNRSICMDLIFVSVLIRNFLLCEWLPLLYSSLCLRIMFHVLCFCCSSFVCVFLYHFHDRVHLRPFFPSIDLSPIFVSAIAVMNFESKKFWL